MPRQFDYDDAFDSNGLLKDRHTTRIPMLARDSVQHAIATDPDVRRAWGDSDTVAVVASDGRIGLNKPGSRFLVPAHTVDAADRAAQITRDMMRDEGRAIYLRDLYETPAAEPHSKITGFGSPGFQTPREGDVCMVSEGAAQGAPGHIVGGVCVPDDEWDGLDARDRAYRQYCDELTNSWRRS